MRTPPWNDEHDRLLAAAAPAVPEPTDAELARVWNRVVTADGSGAEPGRRWGRLVVAAVAGAAVLATSGVAAAELVTARTGRGPVDAEDLRLGGPGEKLDGSVADFGRVLDEETTDIRFPDAVSRERALREQVRDARRGGALVSTGALRAWVADQAICAWSSRWAAATRDGDEAARSEAIEMIQGAPRWPAVLDLDPAPYRRTESQQVTDGASTWTEEYVDESQFHYLAALGTAVAGRDPDVVAAVLAANNGYCRPGLVPDLPQADPMWAER